MICIILRDTASDTRFVFRVWYYNVGNERGLFSTEGVAFQVLGRLGICWPIRRAPARGYNLSRFKFDAKLRQECQYHYQARVRPETRPATSAAMKAQTKKRWHKAFTPPNI